MKFFLILFLFFGSMAQAQRIVSGTVVDSNSKVHLPFATILVKAVPPSKVPYRSMSSDQAGKFSIMLDTGNYFLIISYGGYTTKEIPLQMPEDLKGLEMGNVSLTPNTTQLQEAHVTGKKSIYGFAPGKVIYQVREDPRSIGKNAFDLLRQAPLVSVNGSGSIQLKGKTGFILQLNGKTFQALSANPEIFLQSFDQSQIDRIEVITIPSAKYSAEGITGIINIVTRKDKILGTFGTVTAGMDTYKSSFASLNLSGKDGKFGYSINCTENIWRNGTYQYSLTNSIAAKDIFVYGMALPKRNNLNGFTSLSYQADKRNIITMDFSTFAGTGNIRQAFFSHSTAIDTRTDLKNLNFSAGSNWEHTIDSNTSFVLTYKFESQKNRSIIQIADSAGTANNDGRTFDHSLQADFKRKHLEYGVNGIFRSFYSAVSPPTQDYRFSQNIIAGYISYNNQFGRYNIEAGLREEYIYYKGVTNNDLQFLKDQYGNLFPTFTLDRTFAKYNLNVSLGYSRRISRPQLYYLNPYVNSANPYFQSSGNVLLKPEVTDNIELRFVKQDNHSNYYVLSFAYQYDHNSIANFIYPSNDSVLSNTYINFNHQHLLGLSFYSNITAFKSLQVTLTENLYWTNYPETSVNFATVPGYQIGNSGFFGSFGFDLSGTLFKNLRWSVSNSYNLPEIYLQGHGSGFFYQDLTLSLPAFKNKVRVFASLRQPFLKSYNFSTLYSTPIFSQGSTNNTPQRRGFFGLSYSFGKPKATNIHTRKQIETMDKKGKNTLDNIK